MHEKERHRIILSAVQDKPVVTVQELVDLTDSSEATIRRDIAALHLQKKLRRVRGGAEAITPPHELPRLPTARAVYRPLPDLFKGTAAWIHAGGAHHTVFSQGVTIGQLRCLAEMFDIEFVHIGAHTELDRLRQELRWDERARERH